MMSMKLVAEEAYVDYQKEHRFDAAAKVAQSVADVA